MKASETISKTKRLLYLFSIDYDYFYGDDGGTPYSKCVACGNEASLASEIKHKENCSYKISQEELDKLIDTLNNLKEAWKRDDPHFYDMVENFVSNT